MDQTGDPTTDPNEVAGLLPIAGPKGYGLSLIHIYCLDEGPVMGYRLQINSECQ